MALKLTVRCGRNPRIEPLIDGTVKPKGIELSFEFMPVDALFEHSIKFDDFDVSEMSISESLVARERRDTYGKGRWNWTAIPIFLSRGHLWTNLYASRGSGIESLADLRGRNVGFPYYSMTAAVWFKVILKDVFNIEAHEIHWHNLRAHQGLELGLGVEPPAGVTISILGEGQDPVSMLESGELDAVANLPAERVRDNPAVKRVITDGGRQIITDYYRETRCFLPNHHYVIQDRLVQDHPWVPLALLEAYEEAKQVAYERARRALSTYLYFEDRDFKEQAVIFGEDPYPFGIKAMRKSFDRAVKGAIEQGILKRPIAVEQMYHATTLSA